MIQISSSQHLKTITESYWAYQGLYKKSGHLVQRSALGASQTYFWYPKHFSRPRSACPWKISVPHPLQLLFTCFFILLPSCPDKNSWKWKFLYPKPCFLLCFGINSFRGSSASATSHDTAAGLAAGAAKGNQDVKTNPRADSGTVDPGGSHGGRGSPTVTRHGSWAEWERGCPSA